MRLQLSEAHALRAIGDGGMVVNAPDGQPIRLKYERLVEHQDGNWSWIGRPDGSPNAPEAVLTFGEKAVFGSIPYGNQPALQVQTRAGRTWMVETDPRKLAAQPHPASSDTDMLAAPLATAAARSSAPSATAAPAHAGVGQAVADRHLDQRQRRSRPRLLDRARGRASAAPRRSTPG